ncbi:MAG: pyridoxamine 5'-phosphate oxidase family protein [Parvibaculum sp.]|uniref:HugZ family pyridoxamine 5'-phosphate oxidase n=1 Tax=Parvibaculum sp. TaxID=2024848 RepID=UPI003C79677E
MSESDALRTARRLLEQASTGALGTVSADGYPLTSLVAFARTEDGAPLFLISTMALHTKNLSANPRASLLLRDERGGDPLANARVTLIGTITRLTDAAAIADAKARFLARHPQAATYAGFPDFNFHRLTIERAHLIAGFGRIVEIPGGEFSG